MATIAALGRLPEADEFAQAAEVETRFGSLKRAFALIQRVTGSDDWDAIARRNSEDLLVYLALGRFRRRPPISVLPVGLQRDIRSFFGSYANACRLADDRLFQAGDAEAVNDACRRIGRGQAPAQCPLRPSRRPRIARPAAPRLRGLRRAYLGEIEGANLIKLHRHSGKVSYLVYPDFETDPHPALLRSIKLNLRSREIESIDYARSENPPILHRKETFLPPDHPLRSKFERLTRQEERAGLLDETATIGTRSGWAARLSSMGYALRGHRLVRSKSGDEPTGPGTNDALG